MPELRKTLHTLVREPINSPIIFFIFYKIIAHPILGWFICMYLSLYYLLKFISNLSELSLAKEVLFLYALPFYAFFCLLIIGEIGIALLFLKSIPIMILALEILRRQSAYQIFICLIFILIIELTYKSGWTDFISGGLRKRGSSLVSGGLTEIHSSAVLYILLLLFIVNKTHTKILSIFLVLLTRSRAALLVVAYYLLSVPKPSLKIIYGLFCIFGIVIFYEEIAEMTRFAEILNTAVSESQVLQRKLDQISNFSKLTLENVIIINPFLHDVSTVHRKSLWNVLYLPVNYFATLGFMGFILLLLLMVKKKWYRYWIYLSLANLSGVGLWQYFDATLGSVVYFDGYIFLSLLIIKGLGHEKKLI